MGKTVAAVAAPIVNPVKQVAGGIADIAQGNVGDGLKEIGKGGVGFVQGVTYKAGLEGAQSIVEQVSANPVGAVTEGAQIAASAGIGLPGLGSLGGTTGIGSIGSSILSGLGGLSPGQLANAGTGGQPAGSTTNVPVLQPSSSMPILLIGGAAILAVILLRRR